MASQPTSLAMASILFTRTFSVLVPCSFLPTGNHYTSSARSRSLKPNCIMTSQSTSSPSPQLGFSRRLVLPLLSIPPFLSLAQPSLALDVPLFGIRKRLEQAQKEVVQEVKELVKEGQQLVKEGEKEVGGMAGAVSSFSTSPADAGKSIPPAFQAAAVAGVELVAVLIASAVVNSIVSEPRR